MSGWQVYALRDRGGAVLYVGCTTRLRERVWHHRYNQPWAAEIARVTVEAEAATEAQGLVIEREQIAALAPRYNIRGTDRKGDLGGWATRQQPPARPALRAIRNRRGLTVRQLATKAGVSIATVSRIETGKRGGSLAALAALADALGVDLDLLLGELPTKAAS